MRRVEVTQFEKESITKDDLHGVYDIHDRTWGQFSLRNPTKAGMKYQRNIAYNGP